MIQAPKIAAMEAVLCARSLGGLTCLAILASCLAPGELPRGGAALRRIASLRGKDYREAVSNLVEKGLPRAYSPSEIAALRLDERVLLMAVKTRIAKPKLYQGWEHTLTTYVADDEQGRREDLKHVYGLKTERELYRQMRQALPEGYKYDRYRIVMKPLFQGDLCVTGLYGWTERIYGAYLNIDGAIPEEWGDDAPWPLLEFMLFDPYHDVLFHQSEDLVATPDYLEFWFDAARSMQPKDPTVRKLFLEVLTTVASDTTRLGRVRALALDMLARRSPDLVKTEILFKATGEEHPLLRAVGYYYIASWAVEHKDDGDPQTAARRDKVLALLSRGAKDGPEEWLQTFCREKLAEMRN